MIPVQKHPEGCTLLIRAQPRAKKNGIQGAHHQSLKVAVTAPPEGGRANRAILEVLAEALGLKKAQMEILSGATSRDKVVLIRNVTPDELQNHLEDQL